VRPSGRVDLGRAQQCARKAGRLCCSEGGAVSSALRWSCSPGLPTGTLPCYTQPTFPQAPLSSRTVGVPEYGWRRRLTAVLSPENLPSRPLAHVLAQHTPTGDRLYLRLGIQGGAHAAPALCPDMGPIDARHVPRAPLPLEGATLSGGMSCIPSAEVTSAFIAHTGSCAGPSSSQRFRLLIR